ncbi:Multidrug transporter MdtA [Sedimentisphaera cyanobacteriorum]|uniref:Multidrug transporter MdtA n=1 Tax=Sedimentisphaera cyanobacteriorum TaxID=1940790 RepID=A0A1Q2HMY5_9BACT|nr:efflux RND transporter periplasmic adaptor subunit [Sedimentisphaera cyanobacteriorum]AQQ08798.1 Multidrug transporter MdtA [Sedimentisphaera cyanobacteriorum]
MQNKEKAVRPAAQAVLFLLILAAAGLGAYIIFKSREKIQPEKAPKLIPTVETAVAKLKDTPVIIDNYGNVVPETSSQIVSEVPGKITSFEINEGESFQKGSVLLEIDQRDYEIALETAKASVAAAKVKLDKELAQADVAKREWRELHPNKEPSNPLVLRIPQVNEAEAALESAKARLEKAKLDLNRTQISIPFDGIVTEKFKEAGEYIAPGEPAARVYSTEIFNVEVPLRDEDLQWFAVGGENAGKVEIEAEYAGKKYIWNGRAARNAGMVNPSTRMVTVIVELNKEGFKDSGLTPLPGMFVKASFIGDEIKNIAAVPSTAVHNMKEVWVAAPKNRLEIRKVDVLRIDRKYAYISKGLEDGEKIITSMIDSPVDGMKINPMESQKKQSEQD